MKASEDFWDTIIHSGSIVSTCEFCGKTHYSTEEENSFEEGELEELREKAKKEPDKYIEHSDMVRWGTLNGKQAVNVLVMKLRSMKILFGITDY